MRCYYHPEAHSCGVCKSCQRGICRACAVEVGRGIACSGRCESDVQALDRLLTQSAQLGNDTNKLIEDSSTLIKSTSTVSVEIFHLAVGGLFVAFGAYEHLLLIELLGVHSYCLVDLGLLAYSRRDEMLRTNKPLEQRRALERRAA